MEYNKRWDEMRYSGSSPVHITNGTMCIKLVTKPCNCQACWKLCLKLTLPLTLNSAIFSNLIYHFKMDFRSSNINRAPAIFFLYHTPQVTWSYSHASSDVCWENTILHIVKIIQSNFENNTQIPSVKVCIHFFFGGLCIW